MKRYGICKNVGACSKAGNVQCIDDDNANFVCPECDEPLTESADVDTSIEDDPAKGKKKRMMLTFASAVILTGACVGGYFFLKENQNPTSPDNPPVKEPDTTIVATLPPANPNDSALAALATGHVEEENGIGSISTPYGKYNGDLKDGKANGNGTFQFFKACRISSRDNRQRMAEAGDYISGQFVDNEITQVKWFSKDGTQKGVIIIGKTGV